MKNMKLSVFVLILALNVFAINSMAYAAEFHVSTFKQLQEAVRDASGETDIIVDNDIFMQGQIIILSGKDITITSSGGGNSVLIGSSNSRHFDIHSGATLTLEHITLDGASVGGGVQVSGGTLNVNSGGVITKCLAQRGGGIYAGLNSVIHINSGEVSDNTAYSNGNASTGGGGGIYGANGSVINITNGGFIRGNVTNHNGAGIHTNNTLNIKSSSISGNNAAASGGGIYGAISSEITITDSEITGNGTDYYGAGIYGADICRIDVTGGIISGNQSHNGGGGIYTRDFSLLTVAKTAFTGNTAEACFWMTDPDDIAEYHEQIKEVTLFSASPAGSLPFSYACNNYDIYYTYGKPENPMPTITYDPNGGGGDPVIKVVTSPFITEECAFTREGYLFDGWSVTQEIRMDATETYYMPGEHAENAEVTAEGDLTLYARWITPWEKLRREITTASDNDVIFVNEIVGSDTVIQDGAAIEVLGKDIALAPSEIGNVTLISSESKVRHFIINNEGSLTLRRITLDGNKIGGGIHLLYGGLTVSAGAVITNCYAAWGGAILGEADSPITISDGAISNNKAENGGGIYVLDLAALRISANVFSGNVADQAYWMTDADDIALYKTRIMNVTQFSAPPAEQKPFEYAYNNYDIGYLKGLTENPVKPVYTVTYDPNGGIGEAKTVQTESPFNLAECEFMNEGYVFDGWSTTSAAQKDETNTYYLPGEYAENQAISIEADTTYYARWISPWEKLRRAVATADTGENLVVEEITGEGIIPQTGAAIDIDDKEITLTSDEEGLVTFLSTSAARHFTVAGSAALTLENITLDGGKVGGGVLAEIGELTLNEGVVIENCSADYGGAVAGRRSSDITIAGAKISGNTARYDGGGVYVSDESTLFIENSEISGNTAARDGGGIAGPYAEMTVENCAIFENSATSGGGIASRNTSPVTVTGSEIRDNIAVNGGGIFGTYTIIAVEDSQITGNTATVDGGGIYSNTLEDLTVSGVVFGENAAPQAYWMNDEADIALYEENITDVTERSDPPANNKPFVYAYNNYDISYTKGLTENLIKPFFTVRFEDYDGSLLSMQSIEEGSAAVAPSDPKRPGYGFIGWNNDFSNITADLTVTAQYENMYTADFDNGSAKVHNDSDEAVKGTVVLAVYNTNGSLAVSEAIPFTAPADDVFETDFATNLGNYPSGSYTCKVFFWSEALLPLTEAIAR